MTQVFAPDTVGAWRAGSVCARCPWAAPRHHPWHTCLRALCLHEQLPLCDRDRLGKTGGSSRDPGGLPHPVRRAGSALEAVGSAGPEPEESRRWPPPSRAGGRSGELWVLVTHCQCRGVLGCGAPRGSNPGPAAHEGRDRDLGQGPQLHVYEGVSGSWRPVCAQRPHHPHGPHDGGRAAFLEGAWGTGSIVIVMTDRRHAE